MPTRRTPTPRRCAFSARSPLRRAAYGEALVAAAGGVVTDEARQAFDRALAEQPGQPQARYYVALAAEQDGKKADAIRDYQALLADSPPDAPWRSVVNARLAALNGAPAPAEDAAAIPEAQRPMIEGMVSKLATRLASNGGGVDEWSRLIRAYTVLHEADKAKAALVDAHKALASRRQRGREPRRAGAQPRPRRRQLTRRGRRLALIAAALAVVGAAAGLSLYALSDSIVFFYSPTEVAQKAVAPGARLRIGGLVKTGSVVKSADQNVAFVLTDGAHDLKVAYQGLLPDLFREGQGVVAEGVLAGARSDARRDDPRQA